MQPRVAILLSTYNSEKFIIEQIESIINQSYTDWKLLIRDDASTDSTIEILQKYKDPRIKILEIGPNIGAILSFSRLLELNDSDYFLFCDHDDIWNFDKVERQVEQITELEKNNGQNIPILIHSDLTIINENNELIHPSMWKYGKFDPERKKLSQLLVQGPVTGCTLIGNRALRNLITPIPKDVIMHDWWASIIASLFGIIYSDPIPTLKYRIHNQNQIGVQKPTFFQIISHLKNSNKFIRFFNGSFFQAKAILLRFQSKLNEKDKEILNAYAYLLNLNRFQRIYTAIRFQFFRSTLYRNGLFYLVLFFSKKK